MLSDTLEKMLTLAADSGNLAKGDLQLAVAEWRRLKAKGR